MDREAPGLFTESERIMQDFAREKKLDATFIKDLIQKVLHHPDFDPDEVDHDMHERLMGAIEEGDLQVIDLKEDGDGEQDVRLFKRPAGKVLRELLADPRLAGCQHFAFKEYKDSNGVRILGGHANGSVTFQLALFEVSPWMWRYGRGQPRMVSVGEAESRRKEGMTEARRQGAETLKRRRAERGDDFYERQRSRRAGDADDQ